MIRTEEIDRGKVEQMEIRQLDKETYAGRKFTARYETKGYYDLRPTERGFEMEYVPFEAPAERSFDDVFFGDWLEEPVAFGAFEGWAGTTASASAISVFLTPQAAKEESAPC